MIKKFQNNSHYFKVWDMICVFNEVVQLRHLSDPSGMGLLICGIKGLLDLTWKLEVGEYSAAVNNTHRTIFADFSTQYSLFSGESSSTSF